MRQLHPGGQRPAQQPAQRHPHLSLIHICPTDAIRNGISMLTEDRMRTGSIYTMSVKGNTTIAAFGRTCCNKLGIINSKKENQAFESVRGDLEVKCASERQLIKELSGGNQQKVLVGRWLLTRPKVLIVDEPTRGIDVGSKSEIHKLISKLACEGDVYKRQLLRRALPVALIYDPAVAHHQDAVAHAQNLGQLGGDHDDRHALAGQLADQLVDLGF